MRGDGIEHRFDAASPILEMSIDGHRITAVLGGPNERGVGVDTYLSVRRHRHEVKNLFLADFVRLGTLTQQAADFLAASTRAALSTIIAGPANAGKTTLLRAMTHEIDPAERLITIEHVLELDLHAFPDRHPNVVALLTRSDNVEREGKVTIRELLRTALRLNPSRIFVGEVMPGEEIVSLLNALSSGHDGSISTLHARASDQVVTRLLAYAAQSPDRPLDPARSLPLIASAIDLVVYISKRNARRYVSSIRLFAGSDDGQILSDELFGMADGQLVAKGGISRLDVAEALADAGYRHEGRR